MICRPVYEPRAGRLLRHFELTERHRRALRVRDLDNARIGNVQWIADDGAAQLCRARGHQVRVLYRERHTPMRRRVMRDRLQPADRVAEAWRCATRGVSRSSSWMYHLEKVAVARHAHHPRRASAEV